jgi:hypothetical protein
MSRDSRSRKNSITNTVDTTSTIEKINSLEMLGNHLNKIKTTLMKHNLL